MAARTDNEKLAPLFDGPRAVRLEEHASALRLLNSVLRPESPPSILQEYPLVLGKENIENMRVIIKGNEVVAHAAIYFSYLRSGSLRFKVGGVGSVATHPEYQGQGLGSAVVRDCTRIMRESRRHLSVLWTQRHDFYRKLGYEVAGSSYLLRVKAADLKHISCGCWIAPFSPKYLPAIIEIHEREDLRTERTRKEYDAYFAIPKTNTLIALRGDTVSAYAVMGKGEDLRHCVHEWGGNAEDLLCLSGEFSRRWNLNEFIVLAPAPEMEFTRLLEQAGASRSFEYLAMIRVVDEGALSTLLCDYMRARLGKDFQILRDASGIVIRIGAEQASISGLASPGSSLQPPASNLRTPDSGLQPPASGVLARILFGPEPPSTLLRGLSPETLSALDRALPIPLFIWGLDSV